MNIGSLFERLRSRRLASAFAALAILSVAILVGSYTAHGVHGQEKQNDSSDATPLKIPNTTVAPNAFAQIAKQVGPAVVNINTQTLPKQGLQQHRQSPRGNVTPVPSNPQDGDDQDDDQQGGDQQGGDMQDFLRHFFGGQAPSQGEDQSQVRESLGSGFIVDPKGYILTNNHVVEKADKIYVKLSTDPDSTDLGRPARVIGTDKATDLAVIKIDTDKPLPTVKMGNSDTTQVGDWAIAIGSPFSLSQTVTAGIISAKNRTIEPGVTGQFQHFIQTDAAINPGNSGGPLVNMNGEVIGVNTAIFTQSAGYQGIGFAMPSNTVITIYNDLVSPTHKVTRGSIGIEFRNAQASAINRMYGAKTGVLIGKVTPDGPADKAGLKQFDVITTIDGRPIKDGDDMVNEVASRRPGSSARLGYMRDGKQYDTTVTIGDRDKIFAARTQVATNATPSSPDSGEAKLGLSVRDLTPAISTKIGIGGVRVQTVRPGSFADLQGLQAGLVIVRINKQPTGNKQQYEDVVARLKTGDDVVFEVMDPDHPQDGVALLGGTLQ